MIENTPQTGSATHVALLRGINVGGKNKLAMKDLAALFVEAGATEARTYIQSGNVVFRANLAVARRVPDFISRALAERFGLRVPVILRSAAELRNLVGSNPFLREGIDPERLHVVFLADRPDPARVAGLAPDRSPPDTFFVHEREIFLHCPTGLAKTKLTNAYFDAQLATISTVRTWRTVGKLLTMAGG